MAYALRCCVLLWSFITQQRCGELGDTNSRKVTLELYNSTPVLLDRIPLSQGYRSGSNEVTLQRPP